MLTLYVLQGPDRGKRYQLPENEPQLIGRSSEALPLTDRSMSRRHAELTPDEGRWHIRDLASANGTFVNGEQIVDRVLLSPGDQIRCGSTLFVFSVNPEEDMRRASPIRVMGPEELDATVEQSLPLPADLWPERGTTGLTGDPAQDADSAAATHHLRIVYELTQLTARTVDRDELLHGVMDLIFEEFQPDRGFILMQNDANARPDPVVIRYKVRPKSRDEGHIPVSRTIVQHTMRKGEGILSSNAMTDARFRSGDSVREYGIRSAICVPIKSGDRVFGVINIDSSVANFTYSEAQLRLMNMIGLHTGLALTTAELIFERVRTERMAVMGQTVASLSHSIKNILQGLRGGADAVELALNRDDLNMAREGWPIVSRNLDRIFSLTMNMLAYSKQREPELELVNLRQLVAEAIELIQPQCDQRHVALMQDHDDAMPPVPLDPNMMHQALVNLLSNALDAVPDRRGVITIRTRFEPEGQQALIDVIDNGRGILPEARERVFEPFESSKGQRGTGLGLAVTRKIVQEHDGSIGLQSQPGQGTRFTIVLPVDKVIEDSSETRMPRPLGDTDDGAW